MLLTPPADSLVTDLQPTADLAVVEFLIEQFHCLKPALLQGHKVALDTSWIAHGGLDAAEAKKVPLYYAKFSKVPTGFVLARRQPMRVDRRADGSWRQVVPYSSSRTPR